MRVWITRSQPGADRQAAVLRGHGHQVLVAPVIRIVPLAERAPVGPFTDAVFLSEHAVAIGVPALQAAGVELSSLAVYAVGPSTASRLAELGVSATVPPVASSEGLLALEQFAAPAHRVVLIVAGEAGRDVLAGGLQARGARVHRFAVYRREAAVHIDADLSGVEAIAVGSGDGVEITARLWFAAHGRSDVPVFVPSQRIAVLAGKLGFSRVHTCTGADADALLDGLSSFTTDG